MKPGRAQTLTRTMTVMATDIDLTPEPEGVTSAAITNGLLIVHTSVGRVLVRPVEDLGLRLPEREDEHQERVVDVDPSGKGIFIDAIPMTLTRLRAVCASS